jgi:transposase
MTISELTLEPRDAYPVRRLEVFTGSGRRRAWPAAEKARIVVESYEPGASVSQVARRYALSPQQLFAWRRSARRLVAEAAPPSPLFVPAVIARREPAAKRAVRLCRPAVGVIELAIDGVGVRIGCGADAETIAAVIKALKATS